MPDPVYGLSSDDLAIVKAIVAEQRTKFRNAKNRPYVPDVPAQAPDVYVARTPTGGIPPMDLSTGAGSMDDPPTQGTGDTPGSATCTLWYVKNPGGPGDTDNELWNIDGVTREVWNRSDSFVPGDTFILVARDKLGVWWALGEPAGEIAAFTYGASHCDPFYTGPPDLDEILGKLVCFEDGGILVRASGAYGSASEGNLVAPDARLDGGQYGLVLVPAGRFPSGYGPGLGVGTGSDVCFPIGGVTNGGQIFVGDKRFDGVIFPRRGMEVGPFGEGLWESGILGTGTVPGGEWDIFTNGKIKAGGGFLGDITNTSGTVGGGNWP